MPISPRQRGNKFHFAALITDKRETSFTEIYYSPRDTLSRKVYCPGDWKNAQATGVRAFPDRA